MQIPDDVTPTVVCGPFMEDDRPGYGQVNCFMCNMILFASPEAQELPRVQYACIDCMLKENPNAIPQAMPKSIDRIREIFGESAVREVEEMTKMPIRELNIPSMKDPKRWA